MDCITKTELESLFELHPLPKGHKTLLTCNLGVSAIDFWNQFFSDNAADCLTKFYASRGEKIISCTNWRDPSEAEQEYEGKHVKLVREMDLEFNIVGKPFVSKLTYQGLMYRVYYTHLLT